VKNGIQLLRPFATPSEQPDNLILSLEHEESATRFPIFEQDVSPLVQRPTSPLITPTKTETPVRQPEPEPRPQLELINPLDRPSSPDPESYQNPFLDPPHSEANADNNDDGDDVSSIPLSRPSSRASSHTASIHEDDMNSMSDWTEAFDNHSESSGRGAHSDFDSDSDVVSDAESEASWARVRTSSSSRGMGVN